jgi:hypothetical protein
MKISVCLMLIASIFMSNAYAEDSLVVLGLPLGGKLKTKIRHCHVSELATSVKSACWVSRPYLAKDGSMSGHIEFPDRDTVPKWAAHASYEASVSKNNELMSFKITVHSGSHRDEILESISQRFGRPSSASPINRGLSSATWDKKDIYIHMLNNQSTNCHIEFRSAVAQAEYEKEMAARRKADAARAVVP